MWQRTCVSALAVLVLASGCGGYGSSGKKSYGNTATVSLAEQNNSRESGTATLTKVGADRTKVVIELQNPSATAMAQPAHIHKGSCSKLDPTPEYALANVQSGTSTTTVAASLDELRKEAYAINVHRSAADLKTYVACGDIGSGGTSGDGGGGNGY